MKKKPPLCAHFTLLLHVYFHSFCGTEPTGTIIIVSGEEEADGTTTAASLSPAGGTPAGGTPPPLDFEGRSYMMIR